MKEQFISYETAQLAKEQGYPFEVISLEGESGIPLNIPTQSLLQKWLREEHNCHIDIDMHSGESEFRKPEDFKFEVEVNCYGKNFEIEQGEDEDYSDTDFNSYEEALEKGLQEALKVLNNGGN